MLSDAEREQLIKEIQDAHQRWFTEIEGEAICKHMRQDGAVEAAERIGEIMMKSVMRWLEGNDE